MRCPKAAVPLRAHVGQELAAGAIPKPDILYSPVGDREGRKPDAMAHTAAAFGLAVYRSRVTQHRLRRYRIGPALPKAHSGWCDCDLEVRAIYTPNVTRVPTADRRIRPGISALAMS